LGYFGGKLQGNCKLNDIGINSIYVIVAKDWSADAEFWSDITADGTYITMIC